MRTTACPAPAFGVGNSSSFMTSGAPNSCTTMAFIVLISLAWNLWLRTYGEREFWRLAETKSNERLKWNRLQLVGVGRCTVAIAAIKNHRLKPVPLGAA